MSAPRLSALVACAILLASPRPARAGTPEAEHAAAVESFRRGTQLIERGNLQDAIEAFRLALQHEPSSVGARLDLADCYEKVGAPAPAWSEYTLAESYAAKANDPRRALARTSAAHLEPRLFVVTWSGRAEGVTVRVDGEAVAEAIVGRGEIALTPGSHRIELSAPGKKPLALEVAGRAGETRGIAIALANDAPTPAPAPAPAPREEAPSSQRTWALIVGGVGVVGVVAGSVAGIAAASKKATVEAEANDGSIGAARFYEDRGAAKTLAALSTASFVVGGVGLAAGSILFFTAPSASQRSAGVRVRPTLGGVAIDGRF